MSSRSSVQSNATVPSMMSRRSYPPLRMKLPRADTPMAISPACDSSTETLSKSGTPCSFASVAFPSNSDSVSAESPSCEVVTDAMWRLVPYDVPWGSHYYRYKAGSLPGPGGTCVFLRTPTPIEKRRTTQACNTCRDRKAKCSGDRPSCARCVARGLTCEYVPATTFSDPRRPRDVCFPKEQLRDLRRNSDPYPRYVSNASGARPLPDHSTARRLSTASQPPLKLKVEHPTISLSPVPVSPMDANDSWSPYTSSTVDRNGSVSCQSQPFEIPSSTTCEQIAPQWPYRDNIVVPLLAPQPFRISTPSPFISTPEERTIASSEGPEIHPQTGVASPTYVDPHMLPRHASLVQNPVSYTNYSFAAYPSAPYRTSVEAEQSYMMFSPPEFPDMAQCYNLGPPACDETLYPGHLHSEYDSSRQIVSGNASQYNYPNVYSVMSGYPACA